MIFGFDTLKESYFQQPESLIKPFIEPSKIRQTVSIHGETLQHILKEEGLANHQPHQNFAKTSIANFQVTDSTSSPKRTGIEVTFNMTQKKYDEESSVAQSIVK